MKVGLLCGGPSPERGISLNSARSVLDHLGSNTTEIVPIYFDIKKNAYLISPAQLYSNTPSDFDFKLQRNAKLLTETTLIKTLRGCDIVFPVIHGAFGEDGEVQSLLEKHSVPFIGSGSVACKKAFDKYRANEFIKQQGFYTLPSTVLKIYSTDHRQILAQFFAEHQITRAIVKPASGGSSIGVYSVNTIDEALERVSYLFSKRVDTRVVVEPFCTGTEFTVIILQNRFGLPVAILPTEIETDYTAHQIFDYRKKYLPTRQVTYHCPPRFSNETIERIQYQAEQIFTALGMQDFARFDGWVMPDGNLWFSDFNPVSGMEQNSFLFQQASRIGFSHADLLRYVTNNSAQRQGIKPRVLASAHHTKRKPIAVLFGGNTSERQVSLMSGTNVWLKLRKSKEYEPTPYLLDTHEDVWHLPYTLTLNHTVEEITEHTRNAATEHERLAMLEARAKLRLALQENDATESFFLPTKQSLTELITSQPYIFIALHGGIGENGVLQTRLEQADIRYNGSSSTTSALCMDKWQTTEKIAELDIPDIGISRHQKYVANELTRFKPAQIEQFWQELRQDLATKTVIVKPIADGCSSGIVRLHSAQELQSYLSLIKTGAKRALADTFEGQTAPIEIPTEPINELLFEQFIETDTIRIVGNNLKVTEKTGWTEITVGVLGKAGQMRSLNPSITVAEGEVLSLEEKFQGGTGVNITPPSTEIAKPAAVEKVKASLTRLANAIGLNGYARIDAFMHRKTGRLIIIEINTLPGLTPSTVIYHQALAEKPAIFPTEFLESVIETSDY